MSRAARLVPLAGVLAAAVVFTVRHGSRLPWQSALTALQRAHLGLVASATLVNLIGMVAQGSAWYLLWRPVAPHRWWIAQEANLVGSAVAALSVGVMGEAARVRLVTRRGGVPAAAAVAALAWMRTAEGAALASIVLVVIATLPASTPVRGAGFAAAAALIGVAVLLRFRGWRRLPAWLPRPLHRLAGALGDIGSWRRLTGPLVLELGFWMGQWMTYHLALRASGISVSPSASFTATLAANAGGALKLTPGNVGVAQASIALALIPFGVAPARAVAGGILLQAVQVLPVMFLAASAVGLKRLAGLRAARSSEL
jgi:uncharacterized membrane protein YbhN (UPF0104 family)